MRLNFAYDAAERLVKENNKVYQYSGLDKVASISEGEKVISSYQYSISGQLASATTDGATENFLWDGLALIRRGDTDYTNEPYVTGGNPVVAGDKVLFNDVLGNTVGIKSEDKLKVIKMTAFGETADKDAFFTGKPAVDNLGYAFLFRNYRADQGKWLSQDPIALTVTLPSPEASGSTRLTAQLGYPDGWNNLAYCNNSIIQYVDLQGTEWIPVENQSDPYIRGYEYNPGNQYNPGPNEQYYSHYRNDTEINRATSLIDREDSYQGGTPSPGQIRTVRLFYNVTETTTIINMGYTNESTPNPGVWVETGRTSTTQHYGAIVTRVYVWE